jgi:hypothetical protein
MVHDDVVGLQVRTGGLGRGHQVRGGVDSILMERVSAPRACDLFRKFTQLPFAPMLWPILAPQTEEGKPYLKIGETV